MSSFGCMPLRERVRVRTVGRGDHVAVLERAADADRDRLLADRHVEEAGQVARPEALLDLLLEAANEQHLAEEDEEPLAREGVPLLLDLCHGPHASRAASYNRPVTLGERLDEILDCLPDGWSEALSS